MPLFCSLLVPHYGVFLVGFLDTSAFFVHPPHYVLSFGVSLICSHTVPSRGTHIGLRDTSAFFVHLTQSVLSFGILLVDGLP